MVRAGFAERDCRQNPERQAGIGPGSRRGFVPKAAHQGKGMSERPGPEQEKGSERWPASWGWRAEADRVSRGKGEKSAAYRE